MSKSFRIGWVTISCAFRFLATGAAAGQPFAMQCDDDRELVPGGVWPFVACRSTCMRNG